MPDRAGEDADRSHGRHDAALRSLSGAAPCGRKESGNDGGRVGRRDRRDRRGGRGSAAVAQSEGEGANEELGEERRQHGDYGTRRPMRKLISTNAGLYIIC